MSAVFRADSAAVEHCLTTAPRRVTCRPLSSASPMPLFTSASGVQINGGTFIDTAGDMNIVHLDHPLQLMPAQNIGSLEFVMEGPSRELSGVERNDRGFGAARMQPYGMSPAQCNQQDLMKSKRCFSAPADSESNTELIPSCCR
jgi:hypothetical protein